LVTGAGRRVGNAIARELARRGYRLTLHANRSVADAQRTADELIAGGTEAFVVAAELTDEAAIRQMIHTAHDHFGRIDALVNCAAIWRRKRLEEITAADVVEHFNVNTLATFICCQEVGRIMVSQPGGGAIVNIGDWAIVRPYLDYAAYFPSKGAIPTMTRDFAVELGSRNPRVRVNAILPGPVMLPRDLPEQERLAAIRATIVQREGTAEHIAHAVVFLLENDYVTGVCLPVDGGRSIYAGVSRGEPPSSR
jgi:pteridine reductase